MSREVTYLTIFQVVNFFRNNCNIPMEAHDLKQLFNEVFTQN